MNGTLPKTLTGIQGLDEITGKTLLAMKFLVRGAGFGPRAQVSRARSSP